MHKTMLGLGSFCVLVGFGGCNGSEDAAAPEPAATATQALRASERHGGQGCSDHEVDEAPEARELAARPVQYRHRAPRACGSVMLKILGFNDFHGQLSEGRRVGGRPVGGAAVLATYLKTAMLGKEAASLIVHAGDHVGASTPESALLQDEPAIEFLNLLTNPYCRDFTATGHPRCNVVGTLGNHEFDEGKDELLRLIRGGNHPKGPFLQNPWAGARFPYVSANVVVRKSGHPLLPPFVIRQVGGVRVGVIGAVLKETPTIVTPTGVAGLDFLDEATTINRQVTRLKRLGVRSIIVTIHQGASQAPTYSGTTDVTAQVGQPIAGIVSQLDDEVDVVISGHAHAFTNALVTNQNGHPILVTQAFSASTAYDDIDLEIDRDTGDVISKAASIVTTYSDVAPGDTRDPAVQQLVDRAKLLTAPLVNRPIAVIAADMTRSQTSAGESVLGNFIADAQRAATGTDFAFMNPGGIRADFTYAATASNPEDSDGQMLWGELFTVQPFGNSLVTMNLTGQQLYDLLNQQFAVNRMLQISGLTYTWDPTLPASSRVVEIRQGGTVIDPMATYSVTVNNFLAAGGDGFTVLLGGSNQLGGELDLDALVAYLEAAPQPVTAPSLGRITLVD